jgi:DNA-binding response OmpR family regulator
MGDGIGFAPSRSMGDASNEPHERHGPSGVRPCPVRVLIVEDEAPPREFLAAELEHAGFAVFEAADGQEGLDQVEHIQPDVIVLDLVLPVLSGFALARATRDLEDTRPVGIIAVSALASGALRDEALAAGCDVFLTKPVRAEAVVAQVRRLVGRRDSTPLRERPFSPRGE